MAEIKIPIKIDGFKSVEDMAQAVLNYTYKGKTLKEWADSISKPTTNADRIRAMTDEELARFLDTLPCPPDVSGSACRHDCIPCWLGWLKQEEEE